MVKKMAQAGGLFQKLGTALVQAHEAHKTEETNYGSGGELPGGVELGIAKLVDCKFDTYKTGKLMGKYYFYATGVVVEPKEHTLEGGRVVRIEGLRTSVMEPLCDTPESKGKKTTLDDHVQWVLNEMRKLGVNTAEVEAKDLEDVAATLANSDIYFGFRTWSGKPTTEYPEPKVNHTWTGACEYTEQEGGDGDVVEEEAPVATPAVAKVAAKKAPTPAATVAPVNAPPASAAPVAKVAAKRAPVKAAPAPEPEPKLSDDLEELIALAVADNDGAKIKLSEIGVAAGVTEEDMTAAADWSAVGDLVRAAVSGSGEEVLDTVALGQAADGGDNDAASTLTQLATDNGLDPNNGELYPNWEALGAALSTDAPKVEEAWSPVVSEVYKYVPAGKIKPADCEVTAVFPANQTVNLKNLDDMKPIKGVSWDKLSS